MPNFYEGVCVIRDKVGSLAYGVFFPGEPEPRYRVMMTGEIMFGDGQHTPDIAVAGTRTPDGRHLVEIISSAGNTIGITMRDRSPDGIVISLNAEHGRLVVRDETHNRIMFSIG